MGHNNYDFFIWAGNLDEILASFSLFENFELYSNSLLWIRGQMGKEKEEKAMSSSLHLHSANQEFRRLLLSSSCCSAPHSKIIPRTSQDDTTWIMLRLMFCLWQLVCVSSAWAPSRSATCSNAFPVTDREVGTSVLKCCQSFYPKVGPFWSLNSCVRLLFPLRKTRDELNCYQEQCDAILKDVNAALEHLESLQKQYLFVSDKTGTLHEACEQLLKEQVIIHLLWATKAFCLYYKVFLKALCPSERAAVSLELKTSCIFLLTMLFSSSFLKSKLVDLAESIQQKLSYFNELESINTVSQPQLSSLEMLFFSVPVCLLTGSKLNNGVFCCFPDC